jgi:predicted phage terminase large subunit-like protein
MKFAMTYLDRHFLLPSPPMHHELAGLLERATAERGTRLAVAAPRGAAKSTLVSLAYVLWSICYRRERYILLASDTAAQACELLRQIKDELRDNTRLREDFGHLTGRSRSWTKTDIVISGPEGEQDMARITALGAEQKPRGRRNRQDRPTLIIADDLENEELTRSREQREKRADWLAKSLMKAGTMETNVIVVGTILHHDSVLARLTDSIRSPGWLCKRYRSIAQWPSRGDLWERWEAIYNRIEEYEEGEGPAAARAYFEANAEAMREGAEVLWPQREPLEALMALRVSEGRASFATEKQNDPADPASRIFREEDFQYWDDEHESEEALLERLGKYSYSIYGACDPSLGKSGQRGDATAIVTVLKHRETGTIYVLDALIAKQRPDEIINTIIEMDQRRRYSSFGMEEVQFQHFLKTELERRSRTGGRQVSCRGISHKGDKIGRIQRLQPLFATGAIKCRRRHIELMEQLRAFPDGAHDDGPDALEMAVTASQRPLAYAVDISEGDW